MDWGVFVQEYGLIGLFITSFIGSTVFLPLAIEPLIVFLVKSGFSSFNITIFAATGGMFGILVNYYLGRLGLKAAYRREITGKVSKSKSWIINYGWPGVFLLMAIPFPIPVAEPITILCGIWQMDVKRFALVVFLGKMVRYSLGAGLFLVFF